jgi:hypothetical protein
MWKPTLNRREFLQLSAGGVTTTSFSGWLNVLATRAAEAKQPPRKRCVLLWMDGGPPHMDTVDMKPDARDGYRGPWRPIQTSVNGIQICEHFPQLAKLMQQVVIVRSMSTVEGDHHQGKYNLRTGYRLGPMTHPSMGAIVSQELGDPEAALPNYVAVQAVDSRLTPGPRYYGAGYLGPRHEPLYLPEASAGVENLVANVPAAQFDRRISLLEEMEQSFQNAHQATVSGAHHTTVRRAVTLMRDGRSRAFDITQESQATRDRYGNSRTGQACLLARRLIEAGVQFVEVIQGGWDGHLNNFERVKTRGGMIDTGMSSLMNDLKDRGLLDETLIIWMGEFGRTPRINSNAQPGRDHYPRAWSLMLMGGGVKGGQVIGRTDRDGATVEDHPVSAKDFMATVCGLLNIDPARTNQAQGRPIRIVERDANPIAGLR